MIEFETIEKIIINNIATTDKNFKRIFYGRGGCYEGWESLCIDSIDTVLNIAYFTPIDDEKESSLQKLYQTIFKTQRYKAIVLQHRYLSKAPTEILFGTLYDEIYAYENNLKYKINVLQNQNNGFFGDMALGRAFIQQEAKNKNVLNLFSYTCAFSIVSSEGGASKVVNVDMSKNSLSTGRKNHHLNNQSTQNIMFMPYNILKSWSRIRKAGPYDIIIIDPPSFQKGSFASTTDYQKIIRRLKELASDKCIILAALNNPQLNSQFLLDIFKENAPEFSYIKRLDNIDTYPTKDSERALKNLIFQNF